MYSILNERERKAMDLLKEIVGEDIITGIDEGIICEFLDNMKNRELTIENVVEAYDEIDLMNY